MAPHYLVGFQRKLKHTRKKCPAPTAPKAARSVLACVAIRVTPVMEPVITTCVRNFQPAQERVPKPKTNRSACGRRHLLRLLVRAGTLPMKARCNSTLESTCMGNIRMLEPAFKYVG
jgi:hypothetical protein